MCFNKKNGLMMAKLMCLLILGVVVSASGYTISSTCVNACKNSSVKCSKPATVDETVLSTLATFYNREVISSCINSCHCDESEYAYPSDKHCQVLQSFILSTTEDCQAGQIWSRNLAKWNIQEPANFARHEVIDYLMAREGTQLTVRRSRSETTTVNPWENWCKHQCAEGLGGSACYCDIIP